MYSCFHYLVVSIYKPYLRWLNGQDIELYPPLCSSTSSLPKERRDDQTPERLLNKHQHNLH